MQIIHKYPGNIAPHLIEVCAIYDRGKVAGLVTVSKDEESGIGRVSRTVPFVSWRVCDLEQDTRELVRNALKKAVRSVNRVLRRVQCDEISLELALGKLARCDFHTSAWKEIE